MSSRSFGLVVLLLFSSRMGLAAPETPSAPSASDREEARKHYERGLQRYALGEFDAAVAEFKEAYARTGAPGLLFNLAQASRLAKQYEQALHFYRSYLRAKPHAANRRDVEAFILQIEPLAAASATPPSASSDEPGHGAQAGPERAPEPPAAVAPSPAHAPEPAQAAPAVAVGAARARDRHPGRTELTAGLATLGAGVGALAAGLAFGLLSRGASDDIARVSATGGSWTPEVQQRFDEGRRDSILATTLFAVGGAAAAAGVVVTALGAHRRSQARRLSLAPISGGAAASWSCAF